MDCRCMEFVAAGLCTRKWFKLYQTIRNLTSSDLGILLVVIRLGVTGLKKARIVWFSMCGGPLDDWVNGGYVDIYSRVVNVVLVLWEVGPILRNRYGN